MQRYRIAGLGVVVVLVLIGLPLVSPQMTRTSAATENRIYLPFLSLGNTSFEQLTLDIGQMEYLFTGGNGETIRFDAQAARAAGFAEESIILAQEMAAFSNDIINAATTELAAGENPSLTTLDVNVEQYTALRAYFAMATQHVSLLTEQGEVELAGWCNTWLTDKACTCGHWWYPRPTRAASWKEFRVSNPTQTLTSWGYHQTPNYAGGGWTRSQTYASSSCGNNTFRDHAYILNSNTIREQNYAGFTPRGEPNPEVWASGPWPYPAWPAYVQWWHSTY